MTLVGVTGLAGGMETVTHKFTILWRLPSCLGNSLTDGSAQYFMILIWHRIRQNSGSRKPLIIYEGCQDPEFWLRDLFHKLQSSVRDWWCAPPVEVIRTGTFLYFVDEPRLVRHTNGHEMSQVVNLDGRMFRWCYTRRCLNLSVLLPRPCARLQSMPVRRYCA